MEVVELEWAAAAAATRGDLHGFGEVTAISSDDISCKRRIMLSTQNNFLGEGKEKLYYRLITYFSPRNSKNSSF